MLSFMKHRPLALAVMLLSNSAYAQDLQQTRELTPFEQMLVHVYETNPKLVAEREALKIADEKVSQANSGFRPTLSANATTGRQREKVAAQPWQYGEDTSVGLVAVQPLFSGFGTVEQKRAAEARVQAGRAHLLSVEQNVLFTVISDWMNLCEKERILGLSEQNLSRMQQYSAATTQRFNAGDGTQTDVAQSESRMAQAQARYAIAFAERDSARDTYERNAGLIAEKHDFPPLPDNMPRSLDAAESLAEHNPEMIQAQHEKSAA